LFIKLYYKYIFILKFEGITRNNMKLHMIYYDF